MHALFDSTFTKPHQRRESLAAIQFQIYFFVLFHSLSNIILQSKKVLDNKFDELPLYGLGSCKSANWWKSLGDDLLSMGMPCVVFCDVRLIIMLVLVNLAARFLSYTVCRILGGD